MRKIKIKMKTNSGREKEPEYREHDKNMKIEFGEEKEKMMIMRVIVLSGIWCGGVNVMMWVLNNFHIECLILAPRNL